MQIQETFSKSIDLRVIKEYDKSDGMQISTVLGHVYDVACQGFSQAALFRHFSNYVLRVRNFGNKKAMTVIFFFQTSKISVRL